MSGKPIRKVRRKSALIVLVRMVTPKRAKPLCGNTPIYRKNNLLDRLLASTGYMTIAQVDYRTMPGGSPTLAP
ncbi:MAG: hypothetical protein AB8B63_11905 [Granulosicoccus sp.]